MSRFGFAGGSSKPKIERGYVKWFNEEDGFGEINTDNSNQRVFFDITDTYLRPYMIPAPNEKLEYEVILAPPNSRPYAINVRGPNNQEAGTQKSDINYKNYSITQRSFQQQRPQMTTLNNPRSRPLTPNQNTYNNRSPNRDRLSYSNTNRDNNSNGNFSQRGSGQFRDIPNTGQSGPRKRGKCKWFNSTKGFGFIEMHDGTGDIFVHQSALHCRGFRSLELEEEVEFQVQMQEGGKRKAINVTGPNGVYCKGAPQEQSMNRGYDDIAG
jgi:cold shock CspA family protein